VEALCQTFSVQVDGEASGGCVGQDNVVELCPGGADISVTDENKVTHPYTNRLYRQ